MPLIRAARTLSRVHVPEEINTLVDTLRTVQNLMRP